MDNPYATPPIAQPPQLEGKNADQSRFRSILLASVISGFACLPVSLISERFLPAPLVAYLDSQIGDYPTISQVCLGVAGFVLLGFLIWNYVQLYRFRKSSRSIAVTLTIAGVILCFFIGPFVESSITRVLSDVAMMLWGAVLAMMYMKPYSTLFEHPMDA